MKDDPTVSVIMPAYNAAAFIAEAIESILDQTYRDFEFIIVEDGSGDDTWEIIGRYAAKDDRIRAFRNLGNLGLTRSLNKCVEHVKGNYVCRMDADDVSYPDRLRKQVEFMEAHPEVVISGGTMEVCNLDMKPICKRIYNLRDAEIRRRIFRYSPFCHPSTIIRTEALRRAGGYNETLTVAEDYDLYFRLGKLGCFANLPDAIHKMRVNPSGLTYSDIAREEAVTLYIRLKAVFEYGYRMTTADKVYFAGQLASMVLMPPKLKYWLFTLCRSVIR